MTNIMKDNLEQLYTYSLLSRVNAAVISEPGYGKTKMSYHMAKQAVGDTHKLFLPLSPSTPPEAVTGPVSLVALKEGRLEYNKENTPYDPNKRIVLLDEWQRANEVLFDLLLHATNDVTRIDAPIFWATSNFVVANKRTEAMNDRFGLWYYFEPDGMNIEEVIMSDDISTWTFDLPEWNDVLEVRKAPKTKEALKAIVTTVEDLVNAIGNEKFTVNDRRKEAWREILFYASVYDTGNNSFKSIPDFALKALRFAYPSVDYKQASKWKSIAISVIDTVGTVIEQYMGIAKENFEKVLASTNPNEKGALMAELGKVLADSESELERLAERSGGKDDVRIQAAVITFNKWFKSAAQGKKIGK